MATKYYTHFVTSTPGPRPATRRSADAGEWSGVVELKSPLQPTSGARELKSLLARSFDVDSEEIRILHWARLH